MYVYTDVYIHKHATSDWHDTHTCIHISYTCHMLNTIYQAPHHHKYMHAMTGYWLYVHNYCVMSMRSLATISCYCNLKNTIEFPPKAFLTKKLKPPWETFRASAKRMIVGFWKCSRMGWGKKSYAILLYYTIYYITYDMIYYMLYTI